jgi:hypothetical protein
LLNYHTRRRKRKQTEMEGSEVINNTTAETMLDLSILTAEDHQVIQFRIEQHARANSSNEMNYHRLVNDPKYQRAVVQHYINMKKTMMPRASSQANILNPSFNFGTEGQQGVGFGAQLGSSLGVLQPPVPPREEEGAFRDRIAQEYGVRMSQFQTSFRDKTYDNLKNDSSADRLNTYQPKIGCLGMKTFDFNGVPDPIMFEAMFLYIVDDIEEKQRSARNRAGSNFLERVGMDKDISSYYHAHRKSNHGGASSALYSFNEAECFSFRRNCMKAGLKTDVTAMDEADTRKARNHPYQRAFYGHPDLQKENHNQQDGK